VQIGANLVSPSATPVKERCAADGHCIGTAAVKEMAVAAARLLNAEAVPLDPAAMQARIAYQYTPQTPNKALYKKESAGNT
jgi:hypothetical protein